MQCDADEQHLNCKCKIEFQIRGSLNYNCKQIKLFHRRGREEL